MDNSETSIKVSVIIPNYNGSQYLNTLINSLLNQCYHSLETIFIDNGSTDDSCSMISRTYPSATLIRNKHNQGFAVAVNTGISVSHGKYVVLLNNDTEVEPDWLENLVRCIEQDEDIFSVSSKMIRFNDRNTIDDAGDQYTLLGWTLKRGDGASRERYTQNSEVFSSCAGAAIYRKSILNEIGLFDESFFAYMEDVDISYRAKIHGHRNVYCSKAIVYHVGSGSSGSKYNPFKIRLAARNNIYVIAKNMPLIQLVINLPFIIIGFAVKALFFWHMGYGKEYKEGFIDGIKGLKHINRVRHSWRYFFNYVHIEWLMIKGLFEYIGAKLYKRR